MEYTAVIRTLGKAGDKYQQLLDSLCKQTIKPSEIIVYLAEGFQIPKETCGLEKYVYVKKGMVAQRALQYNEVKTEYILFLDDDLKLPVSFVENMFKHMEIQNAQVISPDVFPNDKRGCLSEILMTFSGRMKARRFDTKYGYKVLPTTGFSYNKYPNEGVLESTTNAGACFLCKKQDFIDIHFEEELWMDRMKYPIGEDQVMFYKMYLRGLKQLTYYNSGIEHLDGGENLGNKVKAREIVLNDLYFRRVFAERFFFEPESSLIKRWYKKLFTNYFFGFSQIISLIKVDIKMFSQKRETLQKAKEFIKSEEYKLIPKIVVR